MDSTGQRYFSNSFLKEQRVWGKREGGKREFAELREMLVLWVDPAALHQPGADIPVASSTDFPLSCLQALGARLPTEASTKAFPCLINTFRERTERICHWPFDANMLFTFVPLLSVCNSPAVNTILGTNSS